MSFSLREQLQQLSSSPVFLACVFSWLCAQIIKTFIKLCCGKIHSIGELFELLIWRTGSMPSAHSALVSALCTSIGFRSGIDSDIFILAVCFFFVTIRDALGVRRASGIQAKKLNEIGKTLEEKKIFSYQQIKEVLGHTPLEVIVGCLLGFFIGLAFSVL
ncbi:MAG: divergent PAP2 family protein [Treponema sp.]|nr:divergent PAP2 family protein [Treponema sp.]